MYSASVRMAAVFALATVVGCRSNSIERWSASVIGNTARDFELPALDGGKVRLSDHRGKPVVLAFWAFG
jgi:cytochrome oxidase Cu insertion factor (SCO1/SenC/PrrC family)